jgi:hypothetical protein
MIPWTVLIDGGWGCGPSCESSGCYDTHRGQHEKSADLIAGQQLGPVNPNIEQTSTATCLKHAKAAWAPLERSVKTASQKLATLPISSSTAATKAATIGWAGVAATGVAAARASPAGVVATASATRVEPSAATRHRPKNGSHE